MRQPLPPKRAKRRLPRGAGCRLAVEPLEDRCLLDAGSLVVEPVQPPHAALPSPSEVVVQIAYRVYSIPAPVLAAQQTLAGTFEPPLPGEAGRLAPAGFYLPHDHGTPPTGAEHVSFGQAIRLLESQHAEGLLHPSAVAVFSEAGPALLREDLPLGPLTALLRKLPLPHPGDPEGPPGEEAGRLYLAAAASGKGLRQAALAFGPEEVAAIPGAEAGHGTTAGAGLVTIVEGAGAAGPRTVPPPGTGPVIPSLSGLRAVNGTSETELPRTSRPGPSGMPEPESAAAEIASPASAERVARLSESPPAPQGAGLLAAGLALDTAALERAVQALVAPLLEAGSPTSLYWVGFSSWLLATALACEAARRRYRPRPADAFAFPAIPADFLPEERA
jgi:hypothetical protein